MYKKIIIIIILIIIIIPILHLIVIIVDNRIDSIYGTNMTNEFKF